MHKIRGAVLIPHQVPASAYMSEDDADLSKKVANLARTEAAVPSLLEATDSLETKIDKALMNYQKRNDIWMQTEGSDDDGYNWDICTHAAAYVVKLVAQGKVVGYLMQENPIAKLYDFEDTGGHDFAIIEDWLVDPWAGWKHFPTKLNLKRDQAKIQEIYGDPTTWADTLAEGHEWFAAPHGPDWIPPRKYGRRHLLRRTEIRAGRVGLY